MLICFIGFRVNDVYMFIKFHIDDHQKFYAIIFSLM